LKYFRPGKPLTRRATIMAAAFSLTSQIARPPVQAQTQPQHRDATRADFDRLMTELSNWGRRGKSDELGAVNLITPQRRRRALGLVKEGVSVSLARNAETTPAVDNPQPIIRNGGREPAGNQKQAPPADESNTGDSFFIAYHGYVHTHTDSLCHFFYKGRLYNGYPREEVTAEHGAAKNSILNFENGIMTRGILIDIPRLKGVEYLEPGTRIYPEDLDAWEKKAHVKVGPGRRGVDPDGALGAA
jgi:Putative cyclase